VDHAQKTLLILSLLLISAVSCNPTDVSQETTGASTPVEANPTESPTIEPTPEQPPRLVADVIFYNGEVLTMLTSPERVEALAVVGEMIVAIGSESELLAMADDSTQLVDLEGRTLMPGFVDSHTHIFNDAGHWDTDLAGAQELALSNGITTLANMFSTQEFLEEMRAFDQSGDLIVRTSLYLSLTDNCGTLTGDWWQAHPPTREPGERLRIGGLKAFADGGTCGELAASEDILPGYGMGEPFFTQEEMDGFFATAEEFEVQLAIHAQGDVAVEQVLAAMGTVNQDGSNPFRHRIEHNAIVRPELRPLYAEYDVVATLFGHHPVCDYSEWSSFFQAIGEDLRGMLDSNPGGHFAWHGDDPWLAPISPLLELASMVTRTEPDGEGGFCQPPDWMEEKAITVEEGLQMMTTGAAYALFREEEVGSLAPGMYADVIIINGDPTAVDPMEIWDLQVLATMVGGEFVYCGDELEDLCATQDSSGSTGSAPSNNSSGSVYASATLPDYPINGVLDGDTEGTPWVSGDYAPQWIEFDLGEIRSISGLRLWVDQDPSGYTRHIIYGGAEPNPTQQLAVVEGETTWGQMLEVIGDWQVRYVRVETVDSPSWVAWLEVEFLLDE
jgi:predicted amidohydrolase YtcJ